MKLLEAVVMVCDGGPADVWMIGSGYNAGLCSLSRPKDHVVSWAFKITNPAVINREDLIRILYDSITTGNVKKSGRYQTIYAEDFLKVDIVPGDETAGAYISGPPDQEHG